MRNGTVGAKVQYSAQSSAPGWARRGCWRLATLRACLKNSWPRGGRAHVPPDVGSCPVDGLASHIRGLRAEIATPSFDQREAE